MSATTGSQPRRLPLVLRNRGFGAVWLGQVLTQAAVRMFQVGVSWWLVAYAVDAGRGLASGLFMAVSTLPAVALAPVVARTVARFAHRSVLRTAAATAGGAVAVLALWSHSGTAPAAAAYAAALLLASCQAFFDPCLTTSVPELVDDEDIEAATGFELSTQSLASLGGALLGALIVDAAGVAGLAAGCAAAYLAAALLITTVRFRAADAREPGEQAAAETGATDEPGEGDEPGEAEDAEEGRARGLREVLAGLPVIRKILICFAAANLFTTAVFVVIPLYTKSELGAGGPTVALLEAALGTGTLLGSVTGTRVPGRPTRLGACLLGVMAAAFALAGLVAGRLVLAGCLVVAGWCVGVIGVRFVALFQRLVPPADKPGFFAVMQAVLGASFPVASLLFGLLGDELPARTLCLIQAAGLVPAAIALALLRTPSGVDSGDGDGPADQQDKTGQTGEQDQTGRHDHTSRTSRTGETVQTDRPGRSPELTAAGGER